VSKIGGLESEMMGCQEEWFPKVTLIYFMQTLHCSNAGRTSFASFVRGNFFRRNGVNRVKHNPINQISINGIRKKDGSKNTTKKTMCRESSEKKNNLSRK